MEAYAKALIHGVRLMDERRHILQPLLHDHDVRNALAEKFRGTFGALAYNHLAPLIAQDLVRDLARLFLDSDSKAGSFTNLHRKASVQAVHRALREQFRCMPDMWHDDPSPIDGLTEEQSASIRAQWRDRDREDFEKSFDEGWTAVSSAIAAMETDPVAKKIKKFRDKYHAHLEMVPLGQDPGPFKVSTLGLTFDDILQFADRYMPAAFELARVLTGNVHDVEGFSNAHRKYGSHMWRVLAGLHADVG
nr:hypothetical protein [Limnobacter sp.]